VELGLFLETLLVFFILRRVELLQDCEDDNGT